MGTSGDVHQRLGRARGLLLAQRDGLGEQLRGERARLSLVGARGGTQRVEAARAVGGQIAAQGGDADAGAGGSGNAIGFGGDLAQPLLLLTAGGGVVDQLRDQAIPEQRNLAVQVNGIGLGRGLGAHWVTPDGMGEPFQVQHQDTTPRLARLDAMCVGQTKRPRPRPCPQCHRKRSRSCRP